MKGLDIFFFLCRTGTVVTKEDSHLITLDKASFDEVLGCWEREKTDD